MVFAVVTGHSVEKIEDIPNEQSCYLENIVYHCFRQLWLVLEKLIEIDSNLFSGYINLYLFQSCPLEEKNIKPTSGLNYPLCAIFGGMLMGCYIYTCIYYVLLKETSLSKKLESKNNRNNFEHLCKTT